MTFLIIFYVVLFGVAGISIYFFALKPLLQEGKEKEAQLQAQEKKARDDCALAFYNKCKDIGVTQLNNSNMDRVKAVASAYNIHESNIEFVFNEGQRIHQAQINAENEKKQRKREERILADKSTKQEIERYAEYVGKDKRVQMFLDEAYSWQAQADALDPRSVLNASKAFQQKELDWATHGGIANGIAGPAAGLAVAMDIQEKNREIRARNEENSRYFGNLYIKGLEKQSEFRTQANRCFGLAKEASTKVVDNRSDQEIFDHLKIKYENVKINDVGTIWFTTQISIIKGYSLKVFEKLDGVIDGSLIADVIYKDQRIGQAKVVFPREGFYDQCKVTRSCVCGTKLSSGRDIISDIRIDFKPYHLWVMER